MGPMLDRLIARGIPGLVAVCGTAVVALWLAQGPSEAVPMRLPGASGTPTGPPPRPNVFPGRFEAGPGRPAELPGSWPQFRGPGRDNIAADAPPLARSWPLGRPRELWSVPMGLGYAAPAVHHGRVYVLDYDEQAGGDVLRCLSLADGREIWRRGYVFPVVENHGMSRTVPAVTDEVVVTLGPRCHVMCVDAASGAFKWGIDLVSEYGTRVPPWHAGQCPLIDQGRVILAPGGKALLVAVDADDGEVVWTTPNPGGWGMTHSSVMPMELAGRRMYVYAAGDATAGGVVGVDAKTGKVLWSTTEWRQNINAPSPLPLGDGRVFLCAGEGCMMLRVRPRGDAFACEVLWRGGPAVFASEQQTPIYHEGYLYGIPPQQAGPHSRRLVCLDPADGRRVWASGKDVRIGPRGAGPYLIADGLLWALGDDGVLTRAEATPAGFRLVDRADVLDGEEAWGPMALAGGRLLVRDSRRLVCLDVSLRRAQDFAAAGGGR